MLKRVASVLAAITAVVVVAVLSIGPDKVNPLFQVGVVQAGDITGASWSLSSTTADATNVTYTLTFTTETTLPASVGMIGVSIMSAPGSQPPSFTSTTVGSGSTTGLVGQTVQFSGGGGGNAGELHMFIQNGATAIPAGTITLVFTGVTNSSGGSYGTNIYTKSGITSLDGKSGPDTQAYIKIGDKKLSGTITDATTSSAISGVDLELHTQTGQGGFFRTRTDSSGVYEFYGVAAGTYMLELSHQIDPNSSSASTVSQYLRFDPITVTIGSSAVTQNISMQKSSKVITGKVKYSDTGAALSGINVNAFSMGPGGFSMAQTGSDGTFTLRVGGGTFFVQAQPNFFGPPGQDNSGKDFFPQSPKQVAFTKAATEAETIDMGDILVDRPDATVTGKLAKPDGSALSGIGGGMGAMNFRTHTMIPIQLQQDGSFSFKAKSGEGIWELNFFDPTAAYALPDTSFKISAGTNDRGTIKMVALDKTITVNVKRIDGGKNDPIASIPVMAFNTKKPGPPFMAFSDSSGVASIKVYDGFEGRVLAMPGGEGGPGQRGGGEGGKPKVAWQDLFQFAQQALAQEQSGGGFNPEVSRLFPVTAPQRVKSGDTVTLNFDLANKAVSVRTVDKSGNLLTDGAFVHARPVGSGGGPGAGFGGPTAGGTGTVYTTKGDYVFTIFFPPDSNYLGVAKTVTVGDSGASADLVGAQKTVTVTGEVRDASNNNAVIKDSSLQIMIGLFSQSGMAMGSYNPTAGTYTAKFAPDVKFRVGVAAGDPGRGIAEGGYIPNVSPTELQGKDNETITHHVTLAKVDAKIKGKVTDQDGKAVSGVTLTADPGLADLVGEGPGGPGPGPGGPPEGGPEFGFSDVTASDGTYTINVAANTYNMVVNARKDGLFATGTTQVKIAAKETKENVNLQLKKADSTLNLEVNNKDGKDLTGADVQVFNEEGTINFSAEVDSQGKATILVPAGTYNVKAGKDSPEDNGKVEGSPIEKVVLVKDKTTSETLQTGTDTGILPQPVVQEVSSSSPAVVSLSQGGEEKMSLDVPAGALSSSVGSSSSESSSSSSSSPLLSVTPLDEELIPTKSALPIVGMSVNATDSSGNAITSLSGQVTGTMKYDPTKLPSGVTEGGLEVRAFNDDSGLWEPVLSSVVDASSNEVTFSTNHFTDFAIVAQADTTPPSAPTSVAAADLGTGGKVSVSWKNPSDTDFDKVNIYRSTASGTTGSKIGSSSSKTATSYEDSGLTDGTKYYYTVRSVDTAGNESTNTDQVNATPSKSKLPKTGTPVTPWTTGAALLVLGLGAVTLTSRLRRVDATTR
ncbi:fibronectin type III domain-containing protein [Candidatus Berkelbacteria bacterium]|nr:fibronectin type III domain-containing protein [Candidatus Berkelbacteria bacterium]